jgi:hypothetical protein
LNKSPLREGVAIATTTDEMIQNSANRFMMTSRSPSV